MRVKLTDFNAVAFGTSGVRALVSDLSAPVVRGYAAAFIEKVVPSASTCVIGHDLRPSSPQITANVIAELKHRGVEVIYVGVLPSPAIAYFAQQRKVPAIIVTGSHIPFDRNGIKFYKFEGEISKIDEKLMAEFTGDISEGRGELPNVQSSAYEMFVNRYTSFFAKDALSGMRIGFYQHSSAGRDIITEIFENLGASVTALARSDEFIPIDTEAVSNDDITKFKGWAATGDYDAIISTDGDADRPLVMDEMGQVIRGDILGILAAKYLGVETIVTPVSSTSLVETSGYFGDVIRTKIGSPHVIAGLQQVSGNAAGFEANGGFLLGADLTHSERTISKLETRDSVLPILGALLLAKEQNVPLSSVVKTLPKRFNSSDRIKEFPTERSAHLLKRLSSGDVDSAAFAPHSGSVQNVDETDGYRMAFENGDIVHLRPSGNAPELRCYVESGSRNGAETLLQHSLSVVRELV